MNPSEESHITDNLSELMRLTDLNALLFAKLLQKRILLIPEKDELEAVIAVKGKFEASLAFYNKMIKKGMYNELVAALDNSGQTAAADILRAIPAHCAQPQGPGGPATDAGSQATVNDYLDRVLDGDGDGGIPISDICAFVMSKQLLQTQAEKEWKTLATKLGFNLGQKTKWSKSITVGTSTEMEIFETIISEWAQTFGVGQATLGKFLDVLNKLGWENFRSSLANHYSSAQG